MLIQLSKRCYQVIALAQKEVTTDLLRKKLPISDEEIEYILERRKLTDKVRRKRDKAIIEGMTYDEYRKGKHHDIVL